MTAICDEQIEAIVLIASARQTDARRRAHRLIDDGLTDDHPLVTGWKAIEEDYFQLGLAALRETEDRIRERLGQ